MLNRRVMLSVMIAGVCGVFPGAALAAEQSPRVTVEGFHATLLSAMQNASALAFSGRRDLISPGVSATFDLEFICEVVAGRYWRVWDDRQRERLLALFSELTVAAYASRFDGYSGQEFKVSDVVPLKRERVLVRSSLTGPEGDDVKLDYVLHQNDDGWRVINVVAEGVSELSIKRAEYSEVLKTDGFEHLMRRLEEQTRALAGAT